MKRSILSFRKTVVVLGIAAVLTGGISGQVAKNREMPPDFKSDGCTFFPDGNYRDCCVEHDKAYYFGGTIQERLVADNELYICVADRVGPEHKLTAQIMWLGVRIGGLSFLPTKFRWGFGNKYPRMSPGKKAETESKDAKQH